MAEPERVRTPLVESQEPVIPLEFVNARISSADWYPDEIVIVADSILVSSPSVMLKDESITVAPSFSLKASVPLAPVMTGASLAAETEISPLGSSMTI